jgi:hypothetical protein
MNPAPLSLREALAAGRLDDLIRQEEARGVGPIDRDELNAAIEEVLRGSRSDDRTSRSAVRRYLRDKRTRSGT